jgi:hypothetical protein
MEHTGPDVTYSITIHGADGRHLEEMMFHLNHVLDMFGVDVEFVETEAGDETVYFAIRRPSSVVGTTTSTEDIRGRS